MQSKLLAKKIVAAEDKPILYMDFIKEDSGYFYKYYRCKQFPGKLFALMYSKGHEVWYVCSQDGEPETMVNPKYEIVDEHGTHWIGNHDEYRHYNKDGETKVDAAKVTAEKSKESVGKELKKLEELYKGSYHFAFENFEDGGFSIIMYNEVDDTTIKILCGKDYTASYKNTRYEAPSVTELVKKMSMKILAAKVTAADTDKFDPAANGEFTDKNKAPLEENKDLAKMIFAQIYTLQEGRLNPVEQKYFNDRAECKAYCEEKNLEFEVIDNPNKPSEKKVTAISKKDSRGIVQSAVAMETLITKLTAGSLVSKTMVPYFRSLTNNAKHLYWQTHGVPYAQPQSKIFASKNEARSEIAKIEAILLTMSKGVEGMAKISVNNMFKDIRAIKNFLQGGLI